LCLFFFFKLFVQVTFTMTAGSGFEPVLAQGAGDGLLVHPEIQYNKAFAEGLPQYTDQ
jgi:hypothetical protein